MNNGMQHPTSARYETTTIFQWNSRGLRSKISDFRQFAWRYKFPVMCIAECGLSPDFRLSNYVTHLSKPHGARSRAAIFVRSDIPAIQRDVQAQGFGEYVCCSVRLGSLDVTIVSLYLPPAVNYNVDDLAALLTSLPPPFVLCGDFNAHNAIWGSTHTDTRGERLASFFADHSLCVLNDGSPTFLYGAFLSSCLDLTIASACLSWRLAWRVDADTLGSDHLPVLIGVRGIRQLATSRPVRRTDWQQYKAAIDSVPLSGTLEDERSFRDTVTNALQAATTAFRIPAQFSAVDAEYARLRALRRRAERRARRTQLPAHQQDARRIQKAVQRHLRKLARDRWRSFASSLSPRTPMTRIWCVMKGLSSPVTLRHPFRALSLATARTELDIATEYCARLAADPSADQLSARDIPAALASSAEPALDLPFSLLELDSALQDSPQHTSPGPDQVTYKALRNLPDSARACLLRLLNASWQRGVVPQIWKTAMVVPILKPGQSPRNIDSFRPIALTSCVGKTLEHMVFRRLSWYLETVRFFPEVMQGSRQGRSAIDNVIDLVTETQQARAEGHMTGAVFLDVKKAYDSVSHSAVIATLQEAGIGGASLPWIQDFLSDRFLFVRTTEGDTDPHPVSRGVPQGSVLSPLLFNVIMASLPALMPHNTRLTLYADDICLWTSAARRDTIQHRLQEGLDIIVAYLADRGLSVSPSKTVAMVFSRRSFTRFPLVIEGSPLPFVTYCKYLGVVLDRDLSWSRHIKTLTTKTNSYVAVLRCLAGLRWGPSFSDLHRVHQSLVLGSLRYSLPILHGISRSRNRDLLLSQAKSLRVCLGVPLTTETYSVLAEAREPPIDVLRDSATLRVLARYLTRHPLHYLRHVDEACPASDFGRALVRLRRSVPAQFSLPLHAPAMWTLARPEICATIPGLQRKNDVPAAVARLLALDHLSSAYPQRRAIYTDGSVANESSAAAYYVPQENRDLALRLPYTVSSMDAELLGLLAALRHIAASVPDAWVILTDSKASLALLSTYHPSVVSDLRTMVLQEYAHLSSVGHRICLQWVPGHTGLHGNTCADAAAKRAVLDAATPVPLLPLPVSACRLLIRRLCADGTRQFVVDAIRPNAFLQSIDPSLEFVIACRCTREEESLLHRLRLNVALTRSLRFKMGGVSSPTCPCCGVEDNIPHQLLHCQRHHQHRAVLWRHLAELRCMNGQTDVALATLLGPVQRATQWRVTKAVLRFLRDTGLLGFL